MDEKVRALLVASDSDACRFLMCALVNMLRTSNSGVLVDSKVRSILADRLEKSLNVKAADVSDALGITRNRSASSRYGNCKYEFIMWYWGFMDKQRKPKGNEVEEWLGNYSGESPSTGSTVNFWIKEAKESYTSVHEGAKFFVDNF